MGELYELGGKGPRKPRRIAAPLLRAALMETVPGTTKELAYRVGRPPSDKTVRLRLAELVDERRLVLEDGVYAAPAAPPEEELPSVELPETFAQREDYLFPSHFDHEARLVFAVKLEEFEFIDWTSTAIELLEAYVGAVQTARIAQASIDSSAAFMTAKSGRIYAHPGLAIVAKADANAQKFREALHKLDETGGGKRKKAEDNPQLF